MVLESIFSFDLSVPLNHLLEGLEERVLIIQVKGWLILKQVVTVIKCYKRKDNV